MDDELSLTCGGRTLVSRCGGTVFRTAGPWSGTVIRLLQHLQEAGFDAAPRVVGSGFDALGRETVSFIEGDFVHPGPWPDEALFAIGALLGRLHEATASFEVPEDAVWRPWFGRGLQGSSQRVIGHCDTGPWNIVARGACPVAFIDWEEAGPVDRHIELVPLHRGFDWLELQVPGRLRSLRSLRIPALCLIFTPPMLPDTNVCDVAQGAGRCVGATLHAPSTCQNLCAEVLAQACWLNAQLHDDDVATRVGLGSPEARARQVRHLLDGYGLPHAERAGFVDTMVAFAVHDAADQARQANVTMESTSPGPLWAITWRTRAASWMLRHRSVLERATVRL